MKRIEDTSQNVCSVTKWALTEVTVSAGRNLGPLKQQTASPDTKNASPVSHRVITLWFASHMQTIPCNNVPIKCYLFSWDTEELPKLTEKRNRTLWEKMENVCIWINESILSKLTEPFPYTPADSQLCGRPWK